ncbi:MAG: hypothetical protein ABW044_05390 [Cellvibrio sp.]
MWVVNGNVITDYKEAIETGRTFNAVVRDADTGKVRWRPPITSTWTPVTLNQLTSLIGNK